MATKCNIINLQKQTQKELEEETPLVNKLKQQQQQKDSNFSYWVLITFLYWNNVSLSLVYGLLTLFSIGFLQNFFLSY